MQNERYAVVFTPLSEADLDAIFQYMATVLAVQPAAENMMDELEHRIMLLGVFPSSCPLVLDEPLRLRGYRKLTVMNYLVFHLIDEKSKQVIIMRILHGSRNWALFL